jgi:hypothetical protein
MRYILTDLDVGSSQTLACRRGNSAIRLVVDHLLKIAKLYKNQDCAKFNLRAFMQQVLRVSPARLFPLDF